MENGITTLKMSTPATAEEKTKKKNDVKARGLLLMALPNEHQLTFKSLDSIFNRLQKIVSRLAILGVIIAQEDLNLKFLSSLLTEWNTYVVVWMNKPEINTMSIDDLYNNFKIVEQKIKKNVVSVASPSINTTSPQVSIARVCDNTVYAFMVENPNGSNVLHQDLEQIHEDDWEAMDLKWQLFLLSVRAKKYYQKTRKKIFINGNDIVGYDKSKVECYNCHNLGHFTKECRAPRSKEGQYRNQDNTRKQGTNKDTSKAMLAINGVGFDWSDMAEEQIQTNMPLMAFSDSEVYTDKTCSKNCLKNYESLKKQYDDLLANKVETEFRAITYKRGLDTVEAQLVTYRKNEVLFSEEVVVLKIEVRVKQYEINTLKKEFEKPKQEKDAIDFKIEKFDKASKDLDQLLGSQITDKSKKGFGYSAVLLPHTLIYNRPNKQDLSYSSLEEFKEPEFRGYGPENSKKESNVICESESDNSKENSDKSLVEEQVLQVKRSSVEDDEEEDEPNPKFEKKIIIPTATNKEFVKPNKPGNPQHDDTGFIDSGCSRHMTGNIILKALVLSPKFKLPNENHILLKNPRKDNMYNFDMKNIVPKGSLTFLVAKATLDESMLCTELIDETSEILKHFIKEIENLVDKKVKIIRSDNGTEFKNKVMENFLPEEKVQFLMTLQIEPTKHCAKSFYLIHLGEKAMQEELLQFNFNKLILRFANVLYGTIEDKKSSEPQPPRFKDPSEPSRQKFTRFKRGKIDQTLFIMKQKGDILLVQVYVDDIIFGSTNKELCTGFEKLMKYKFQMSSMGELTFFLRFPSYCQDKITSHSSHRGFLDIFKGKPTLGIWYSRDSPFELVAYTDSDYAGATLDRKSTTGGWRFWETGDIWQYLLTKGFDAADSILGLNQAIGRGSFTLDDAEGTDCLPTYTIFEEFGAYGKFNLSKYIFDAMVKHLDGGVKFLLSIATDSHSYTLLINHPSSSQPKKGDKPSMKLKTEAEKYGKDEHSKKPDDSTAGEAVTTASIDDSAVPTTSEEITLAQTLIQIKAAKPKVVTTAATTTTTTRPKDRGVVVQEPSGLESTETTTFNSKDKGIGEKKKAFAAAQSTEKKIIRPPTNGKNKENSKMSTYLKGTWVKLHTNNATGIDYEEKTKVLFDKEMKRVNTFVAMGSEVQESKEKMEEGREETAKGSRKKMLRGKKVQRKQLKVAASVRDRQRGIPWC
ncbi:ribonuclease H-like domain-containing protein [Tanacetum coccineum]|uniref:Ribonuclease H-like domain-containing protein n=1 Tax=Tanacetum coccineum TaxID=301880 RepID=A0ABQ4ZWC7_9ASTR